MNDPGLEEPLNETQNRIEGERKEEGEDEEEAEQTFLNPRSNHYTSQSTIPAYSSAPVDGGLLRQHFLCLL